MRATYNVIKILGGGFLMTYKELLEICKTHPDPFGTMKKQYKNAASTNIKPKKQKNKDNT